MPTRVGRLLCVLGIALAIPTATMGATTPVAVYHGTWSDAQWTGSPDDCFFVFLDQVQASGNWNVTILPGGTRAAVHMNMFTTTVDPQTGELFRVHVDAWGGRALEDFWTVDSFTSNGFVLHLDTTTPVVSTNTFALADRALTFTISPWAILDVASCTSAIAQGAVR